MYNWKLAQINAVPEANGLTDIVQEIHWRYELSDGVDIVDVYGSVVLDDVNCPITRKFTIKNAATSNSKNCSKRNSGIIG